MLTQNPCRLRGQIYRYIAPSIWNIPYQSLTATQIERLYGDMASRGLSNQTIKHGHRLIREALVWTVKKDLLKKNPSDAVDTLQVESKQLDMWDLTTIHDFLELCDESQWGDLWKLAIYTRLRRSELAGLTWENVDLSEGTLRVVQTL